jgi:UDP-N-acetylmuramyl-tripeptide synthetase
MVSHIVQATAGPAPVVRWLRSRVGARAHLRLDSRRIEPGDVFIAAAGRRTDGGAFIAAALDRGAGAILLDAQIAARLPAAPSPIAVPVLTVEGLGAALGAIAAEYYGRPTEQIRTVGITGTNGKTSSCIWLAQVLESAGLRCATMGTLGFGFPGALRGSDSNLTTPDAVNVQRLAREACDRGAQALAMEASSIGLDQGRVDGVRFDTALFTNLSRDHLDYHADMAHYAAAKSRLFDWPELRHAVINLDDAFGRELAARLAQLPAGHRPATIGTGIASSAAHPDSATDATLRAEDVQHRPQGLRFRLVYAKAGAAEAAILETGLYGTFNVANLLGVIGAALACGIGLPQAAAAAAVLQAPPGRLQRVARDSHASADEPLAIVDYAHTPDAIAKALEALRPIAQARQGLLWIVFGAGGDRDRGKRPDMAAAAAAAADRVVITSDNPRGEKPEAILDDVAAGLPAGARYTRHPDRTDAINAALRGAASADVVLIAGKGHEDYQEIGGQRLPFSDVAVARSVLRARAGLPA